MLELVNCLSSHRALELFLHFWKSLQYPELCLVAACARAGTWGLGRVVSSELRLYRKFFGEAGVSGYLGHIVQAMGIGRERNGGGGGCRSCSGSLGELMPDDGARLCDSHWWQWGCTWAP